MKTTSTRRARATEPPASGTRERRTSAPPAAQSAPLAGGVKDRRLFDSFADREWAQIEQQAADLARKTEQAADEAPAWRAKGDGVDPLGFLIAQAVCSGEHSTPFSFMFGALLNLSEELEILHAGTYDEHDQPGYLSYSQVRTGLWRLARRAEALVELSMRFSDAERKAVTK